MLTEEEICEKYRSGMSMAALAMEAGRSQCYIDGVLARGHVEKRRQGRPGGVPRLDRQIADRVKLRIVELYESGLSSLKVAQLVGVSKTTVLRTLKLEGIDRRTQKVDIGCEAERLYLAGMSCIQIASSLSTSKRSVLRYLSSRGVAMRAQENGDKEEIVSAYLDGRSADDVAKRFGVSSGHVFSVLRNSGVRPRRVFSKHIDLDMTRVAALYRNGKTPEQIGQEMGASRSTILSRLSASGIEIRKNVYSYKHESPSAGNVVLKGTWELAYARVLDARVAAAEISKWEYEPDRLSVLDGLSYIPDFKVHSNDGFYCYHEIKGKLWARSFMKIVDARRKGHNILLLRRHLLAPIFRHFNIPVAL